MDKYIYIIYLNRINMEEDDEGEKEFMCFNNDIFVHREKEVGVVVIK